MCRSQSWLSLYVTTDRENEIKYARSTSRSSFVSVMVSVEPALEVELLSLRTQDLEDETKPTVGRAHSDDMCM